MEHKIPESQEVDNLKTHGVIALVLDAEGRYLLLEDSRPQMLGHWAPPHGRCEADDGTEENGVVRETFEETGLTVRPLRKLHTQPADTKVKTVSFWEVELAEPGQQLVIDPSETSNHGWFTVQEALETLQLYPGTRSFFEMLQNKKSDA